MFSRLFKKNKSTEEDFLKELLLENANNNKLDKLYKSLNIELNNLFYENENILHHCCKKNLYSSVLWLVKNGIDLEIENEKKETAIFYAIKAKSSAILQILLENNVNTNHLNINHRTALQDAVIGSNNRIVHHLIAQTKELNNCDIDGNNVIFDAVANGNIDIIKSIASKKNINLNHINNNGDTVLQKEVVLKNNDMALLLIELGVDPTILDGSGKSFLFYAISKGFKNIELIEKAVKLRYDINKKNSENKTLLMESINYYLNVPKEDKKEKLSHLEMIKALIHLGINVNAVDNNNENIFFTAAKSEDRVLINLLFENCKGNLNQQNNEGNISLLSLILTGKRNVDLIKLFLIKGANPNLPNLSKKSIIEILIDIILHVENKKKLDFEHSELLNEDGEYANILDTIFKNSTIDMNRLNSKGDPLFFDSILFFNFKLFKIIKTKNMDLNQKDIFGNNIIFKLMKYNEKDMINDKKLYLNTIKSLVNIGIDINAKNNEGSTALHLAVEEKCQYTVKLLLDMRADCLSFDDQGRTPMHICIWKNTTRYLKLLNHYNPEVLNLPDKYGIRPINYAAFMGKRSLVIEMLDLGALINNPFKKDPKILKFLEKYHNNILNLDKNIENEIDALNLRLLADNMKKEFNIG